VSGRDFPRRIVCLTEEPTEILYALGEGKRIVGISAYTCRPPQAREEKPVVSAFIGGNVDAIAELAPDLVIGFSDIQGKLARQLIERGLQVLIFNQRSIEEILHVILAVGRLVGAQDRAVEMVEQYESRLEEFRRRSAQSARRPRVYFEEWDAPSICGIRWVSELIEIAGGTDIFAERARGAMARDRTVEFDEILRGAPEVVLASWCGKPFDAAAFRNRPGFEKLPAVRDGRVHEIDPSIILQPGPACLSDGLDALFERIHGA
jgi:iron complex transport system substrate-binding protein